MVPFEVLFFALLVIAIALNMLDRHQKKRRRK